MKNWKKYTIILLLLGILGFIGINVDKINRLTTAINLFEEGKMAKKFKALHSIFPSQTIPPSEKPFQFKKSLKKFNFSFTHDDKEFTFDEFLKFSNTSGFLVLKNDTIVYENYFNEFKPTDLHISWSVSKSMISALIGVAINEGLIDSEQDSIGKYVPSLLGSAYGGVSIENVLHMSSGIKFDESYNDFNSDINRVGRIFALGQSFENYIREMERERNPGQYNHYVSMDTQVLGMLINSVTNGNWKDYFYSKLWNPIGAESSAKWITDDNNMFAAFGGFNATLRDYAHFGYMYTSDGQINNRNIVDSNWIQKSWSINKDYLMPGNHAKSSNPFGYGYQWWIPAYPAEFYAAIGIYGQYIICDPVNKITIVKLSANERFRDYKSKTHKEHFSFYKALIQETLK